MQPHPDAEGRKLAAEVDESGPHLPAAEPAGGVAEVDPIGRGVLRDDQQLLDPGPHQPLRLGENAGGRTRYQIAPERGDDAEAAAVVAAFGNFQIGIVPWRQSQSLRRHQVELGIMGRRHHLVDGRHHLLIGLGTGHRQHRGMGGADLVGIAAHAAGDDHPAVLGDRLADRLERLALGGIEEPASVDDHRVGALVIGGKPVSLGRQAAQDPLAVDERLRAAEADQSYGWDAGSHGGVR